MEKRYTKEITSDELIRLYSSVGWSVYTEKTDLLRQAIGNSTYVVSMWEETSLVALARCLSDDASIMYLQDILVTPTHQRRGIGRELLEDCLAHFGHVRQRVLLTDNSPGQLAFYRSLGFESISTYRGGILNAFVLFK